MIPGAFRSRRSLANLNTVGVGLAMAAATAAVFMSLLGAKGFAIPVGLPTLVLGTVWARLLRWPVTISKTSRLRVGWFASIPLAATNAAFAAGIAMQPSWSDGSRIVRFLGGMILGATFGAMFWIPALLLVLVIFGLPIARAHRLAKQGLAGEERGEATVAAASAAISSAALVVSAFGLGVKRATDVPVVMAFAVLGLFVGVTAFAIARRRDRERQRFVAEVQAGKVPQFRVDDTDEGKVLVRVVAHGDAYRVMDYEEEIAALDREGEVVRGTPRVG